MKKFIQLVIALLISLFPICHSAHAQAGIFWTSQNSAADNGWQSVTFGANLFVAVSGSGTGNRVMTSPDGITWTSRTSAADNSWNEVTYGNNLFVAVASSGTGNRVMTSPDGINWTIRTSATNTAWRSVAYGAGLFVAVAASGAGNRVMTSPDGITWTSRLSVADYSWNAITYANNLFVAVASSGTGNRVMRSSDGIFWTSETSANDLGWNSITYGAGLYVAVAGSGGSGAGVMTSPDAITWTSQVPAADNGWNAVSYGNGLFVAVSSTGIGELVMTSPDGINWTSRTPGSIKNWFGVTYNNGLFVAVSTGAGVGNRVMTSGTFSVLPLTWLSVNGNITSSQKARISWRVVEQDVRNYLVEKSSDAISYSSIADINSQGDGDNTYTFTEMQTLLAKAYYRVKQTDIDGRFSYSSIIMLRNNYRNPASAYPNPAKDLVTIIVGNHLLNKNAILTDMHGKGLQTIKISNLSFVISMTDYAAGIYFMKIENETPLKIIKE